MRWVTDRSRLTYLAGQLARATACEGMPSGTFAVSASGNHLEYTVRVRNTATTVRVAVSETDEVINLHLPGTVAFIRKEQLRYANDARLGN